MCIFIDKVRLFKNLYFCELFIFLEVRVVLLKYKGLKNDIFERVKFNLVYVLDIVLVFLICCIDILIFIR